MEAGLKAPEFIQEEDFKVVIWRTDQPTDQPAVGRKMIELIRLIDKPSKSSDLQLQLGLKHKTNFRKNYIDAAILEGYIVASHPDNPTHPDQVYSLTEKGRSLRNKIKKG